jgi:hypothetical protein
VSLSCSRVDRFTEPPMRGVVDIGGLGGMAISHDLPGCKPYGEFAVGDSVGFPRKSGALSAA